MNNSTPKASRQFLHALTKCPHQCEYCFAKWETYKNSNTKFIHNDSDVIVYPFCDSEMQFQNYSEGLSVIANQAINANKKIIISISTKSYMQGSDLNMLNEIHNKLSINGGFLKLGVSITNISNPLLERGTASYHERVKLLKLLSNYSFFYSIVLKPILPFISLREYTQIIDDTCNYVEKYLIGGLYVNEQSAFYKDYSISSYDIQLRDVEWLGGAKWLYIESKETQNEIKKYLIRRNKKVYDSDQSLIESWL